MRSYTSILLFIMLAATGKVHAQETLPDSGFRVIDVVDLPGKWSNERDGDWYLQFRERWIIDPKKTVLTKKVKKYHPLNHSLPGVQADSLQHLFASMIRELASTEGKVAYRGISYEFILLEPHLEGSGNTSFPSRDSMDQQTLQLQRELASLISRRSRMASLLDLEEQLLSVHFHEDWYIDPTTLEITKEVQALTPVIWQRRKTVQGEPVNDADTGYPVYYKNMLERIQLRNP